MTDEETFEVLRNDVIAKSEAYNTSIANLTLERYVQIDVYEEVARLRILFTESSTLLLAFALKVIINRKSSNSGL